MVAWEIFDFKGKTVTPKMTIRRGGQIGLNGAAVTKYELGKYQYVILKIDREEQKIGIKFTNNIEEKGVKSFRVVQGGVSIAAKNFIEHYELNKIKEKRLKCEWNENEEMIIAEYSK